MNIEDIYQEKIESLEKRINSAENKFFKEMSYLEGIDIEKAIVCGSEDKTSTDYKWYKAYQESREFIEDARTLSVDSLKVSKDRIVANYPFSVSRDLIGQIIVTRINHESNCEDIPKRYIRK